MRPITKKIFKIEIIEKFAENIRQNQAPSEARQVSVGLTGKGRGTSPENDSDTTGPVFR